MTFKRAIIHAVDCARDAIESVGAHNGQGRPARLTVAMKGSEILDRIAAAKEAVGTCHARPCYLLSPFLRPRYLVMNDGHSFCEFSEKDVMIFYSADCCSGPWTMKRRYAKIYVDDGDGPRTHPYGIMSELDVDPCYVYDVSRNLTAEESVAAGVTAVKSYSVQDLCEDTPTGYFKTLAEADCMARHEAEKRASHIRQSQPELSQYVVNNISNDAHRAHEQFFLRRYNYYVYPGGAASCIIVRATLHEPDTL